MADFQSTGTTSFPICRLNSPALLPHGAGGLFICAGGALDAVVAKTRTVEELMKSSFHRFHRRAREEWRRHVDFLFLTGRGDAETPFRRERELRSCNIQDQSGAGEPGELHFINLQ